MSTITAAINGVTFKPDLVEINAENIYKIIEDISGFRPVPQPVTTHTKNIWYRTIDKILGSRPAQESNKYGLHNWNATIHITDDVPTIVFTNGTLWKSSRLERKYQWGLHGNTLDTCITMCTEDRLRLKIHPLHCDKFEIEFNPQRYNSFGSRYHALHSLDTGLSKLLENL